MDKNIQNIVVVGGGTAGWITANVIAAEHGDNGSKVKVVLIESPDVPIIGVGEGTWPSLRMTLQKMGLSELDMIRECDASFKQGTCFSGWATDEGHDNYLHPFSLPAEYTTLNLAEYWLDQPNGGAFSEFVSPQAHAIRRNLAPKQLSTPEYAFNLNYGYHFDAGKLALLLHRHGVEQLGVNYVSANVTSVKNTESGDIEAVCLSTGNQVNGDLFVDCTGQRGLLIAEHFGVPFQSVKHCLFNDRALAVQVPYDTPEAPIASVTRSTAQEAGWIWDIGLQSRRGIGYVFASDYCDDVAAEETLAGYLKKTSPGQNTSSLSFRTLKFEPGHRETFWVNNCVAVGLSAGFVEPLEASAIALIEQAAAMISQQLPANRQIMTAVASRFNQKMSYHWEKIVEFLKLHYVLSARTDSPYWLDNQQQQSCPASLQEKLLMWQMQTPWHDDAPRVDELFPSASYQYVVYGMGFKPAFMDTKKRSFGMNRQRADQVLFETREKTNRLLNALPGNRELLTHLRSDELKTHRSASGKI